LGRISQRRTFSDKSSRFLTILDAFLSLNKQHQSSEGKPIIKKQHQQLNLVCYYHTHYTAWTTWVSQHQKGKTNLDLNEERDAGVRGWKWHQLDDMQTICTLAADK